MDAPIQILPALVANQIAAGEVVQRPASAVKELMENAIDAGAQHLQIIVKQAGKYLIQIVDDGCGMNADDARLAFQRHATSKITKIEDLFALHTFGFRGEALASIAAVSEVELKTRTPSDSIGVRILIRGSEIKAQEAATCPAGTSISVRNLFYNVPARRRFLKTDIIEYKNIETEVRRVALCRPDVAIALFNDGRQALDLPKGSIKSRILKTFDSAASLKKGLLEIETTTDIACIQGFVSMPEVASARDKQYFFVNGRYFQSAYLRSAVVRAYEKLLPAGVEPAYFVFLKVDPKRLDVNIHPSKTEVKFDDEQVIWQLLHAAVRAALGKHLVMPIDYEGAKVININLPPAPDMAAVKEPQIALNAAYNPFTAQDKDDGAQYSRRDWRSTLRLPPDVRHPFVGGADAMRIASRMNFENAASLAAPRFMQIAAKYIAAPVPHGLMIIHQARAHWRILYEQFLHTMEGGAIPQTELFPRSISLSEGDYRLLLSLAPQLHALGMVIADAGNGCVVVQAIPAFSQNKDAAALVEDLLACIHENQQTPQDKERRMLAASLSHAAAIRAGRALSQDEMLEIHAKLFACKEPHLCPQGKPTLKTISSESMEKWLEK
jgi:DNA mismatch repair protein MutL